VAGERTIKIKFTGDTTSLNQAAAGSEQALGKWQKSTIAFGTAAGIALERAGRALFDFAKSSVSAFADAQESQARLEDAFTRFPNLADTNIGKLQALNTQLEAKTKFDDDATASGQAVLAQFGLTGKQLEELTPLLQDYAAKTGQDLPGAAEALGKAFLGNTKALKAVGIEYKSTGDQATDVTNITKLLREQVGGFAEKQGKTAAGQAAILDNQFGELKETLGSELLPVLLKASEVGLKVVDWISQNREVVLPLIGILAAAVAIQWAWNIALAANPIGLIITAIVLLVAGIVLLATKTTFFQDIWNTSWGFVKRIALDVWNWLTVTAPAQLEATFKSIATTISSPFITAFNFIADAWNNTIGKLSWSVPDWIPFIGGKTISAPKLPHVAMRFHQGGRVPGPFGMEVPAILRAGEVVQTAEQAAAGTPEVHVFIGETELRDMVRVEVVDSNRATRRRVLAGAGAR